MKINPLSTTPFIASLWLLLPCAIFCHAADDARTNIQNQQRATISQLNTSIDARQIMDTVFQAQATEPSQDIKDQSIIEGINRKNTNALDRLKIDDDEANIEFQFENADLENLVTQISEIFEVTFLKDDLISPLAQGAKTIKGSKISFKTQEPLTRKQAWNLFVTFLDIAGFAIVPQADPTIFRIAATPVAQKSPIPSFIGTSPSVLPESDQLVRYLYFVENASLDTLDPIIQALRSTASSYIVLKDLNAFILTDRAYNIRSLMSIVTELDRASSPQAMSVLKLKRANAQDVKKLYDDLTKSDDKSITARLFPARKQPTSQYFPENTRIIAEPRTNSLVLLGAQESIAKIEDFILNHVDVELGQETRSPLHIYPLKYADAKTIAAILTDITKFGKNTTAGKLGGVRDGDKYLKSLVFTAEPTTNRLIIRGDYEDYMQVRDIIAKLDEAQPQIAVEILILTIDLRDTRSLGGQIRSKSNENLTGGHSGLTGTNVKFQTSGMNLGAGPTPIILNNTPGVSGVARLLGNLINVITSPGTTQGNTVVTLGSDAYGVWGIFNALSTITNTQVVSNPFLTVSNKQEAEVDVGTQRRVISARVISGGTETNSFANDKASLNVKVTPQINSDGMIVLDLKISLSEFIDPDFISATKTTKAVDTVAVLGNEEVLALGGLVRNRVETVTRQTPVLGSIPILGWLFKNKTKVQFKENLLILISTHIIPASTGNMVTNMTQEHIEDYRQTLMDMSEVSEKRDPVDRAFFKQTVQTEEALDDFLFQRNAEVLHTTPLVNVGTPDIIAVPKKESRKNRRANRCIAQSAPRSRRAKKVKNAEQNYQGVSA